MRCPGILLAEGSMDFDAVFVSGVLFLIFSILSVGKWIINAMPEPLDLAISAEITVLLGLTALGDPPIAGDHPIAIGEFSAPKPLLAFRCFVVIVALHQRRVAR